MVKNKNVVVTGSNGFIGKNLTAELKQDENIVVETVIRNTTKTELRRKIKNADIIFHLAGVNRPEKEEEFMVGNRDFTEEILKTISEEDVKPAIVLTSSIQSGKDNPYGRSKKASEELLNDYATNTKNKAFIYRLPNVFGKWCKPNYNSVVATFCHNISHDLEIQINNPEHQLNLVYIDDILNEFKNLINRIDNLRSGVKEVNPVYQTSLGQLASQLQSFKLSRETLMLPNMKDELTKKLYSTYLSYLSENDFSYNLETHKDNRGSFTEFLKSDERGQVSINVSKPRIVKGNHWHHTKNEKFLVVSGEGVIRFRKYNEDKVIEYFASDKKLEVIDIPTGYTHNIENLGNQDMVTIMWANELFDSNNPDTYFEEV